MVKMGSFINALNILTGATARHNSALRAVNDWAVSVRKMITDYDLHGSSEYESLLQDSGNAKFDLTAISYNGKAVVKPAKSIRGQDFQQMVINNIEAVENLRRILIKPSLRKEKLDEVISELLTAHESLQDSLNNTDFM